MVHTTSDPNIPMGISFFGIFCFLCSGRHGIKTNESKKYHRGPGEYTAPAMPEEIGIRILGAIGQDAAGASAGIM